MNGKLGDTSRSCQILWESEEFGWLAPQRDGQVHPKQVSVQPSSCQDAGADLKSLLDLSIGVAGNEIGERCKLRGGLGRDVEFATFSRVGVAF